MKKTFQISLIVLSVFFTGCFEYAEKLWFNKDGSGKMTFKLGIDESLTSMLEKEAGDSKENNQFDEQEMKSEFESIDGIQITQSKSYSDKGKKWIELDLVFDSFESLAEVSNKDEKGGFIGKISIVEDEKGDQSFSREISMSESKEEDDEENPYAGMMENLFGQYYWEYETHFPTKILSANTADGNIDNENNKVTWTFSLLTLMKEPQIMKATFVNPKSSGRPITLIIVIVVVLIGGLLAVLKREKS